MVTCAYCGKDELLPFNCPHCGKQFCAEHRIPETHRCSGLATIRTISMKHRESGSTRPVYSRSYWLYTNVTEWAHLGGAILIVFLVEGLRILYPFRSSDGTLPILSTIMLGAISAFLLHELAHKLVAQHYGMLAEFRLDPIGVGLSLLTAIPFLPFKILAPGRMMIVGYRAAQDKIGRVALAGILANLGLAAAFTLVLPWYPLLFLASALNVNIAFFNLLPLSNLDGRRIFDWNKRVWLIIFGVTTFLWIFL